MKNLQKKLYSSLKNLSLVAIGMIFTIYFAEAQGRGEISGTIHYTGERTMWEHNPCEPEDDEKLGRVVPDFKGCIQYRSVVVSDAGELKWAVASLEGLTEVSESPPHVVIDQVDLEFLPHVLVVEVGQDIILKNSDTVAHNIRAATKVRRRSRTLFNLAMVPSLTLPVKKELKEGLVSVSCDIHPHMRSHIRVVANKFYGVSDDDGSFVISGVPAGQHKLKIWHEKLGEQEIDVVVKAGERSEVEIEFN